MIQTDLVIDWLIYIKSLTRNFCHLFSTQSLCFLIINEYQELLTEDILYNKRILHPFKIGWMSQRIEL